jgi:excinuclease ABC subunit C
MKEVVLRRYKRVLNEEQPMPQLIIIDGGKGQLSAAMESLTELGLEGKTTIIGLAKNEEEVFYPRDQQSIKLPWDSDSLKLIRRIRDEVHRFGINFHRNQRSRGTFVNELEQIKGIGKSTADVLLKEFKSIKKIRELSLQELSQSVGISKAKIVLSYFKKEQLLNTEEKINNDHIPSHSPLEDGDSFSTRL